MHQSVPCTPDFGMENGVDANPGPAGDPQQVLELGKMVAALHSRQCRCRNRNLLRDLADRQPLAPALGPEAVAKLDRINDRLKGRGVVPRAVWHLDPKV